MVTQWYCQIMGDERGPVTVEELRSMVSSGVLAVDDLIRSSSESTWRRADSFPELFGSLPIESSIAELHSGECLATGEMPAGDGTWCSLELKSTDTTASIQWSTSSAPTISNATNVTKRALLVKVPHRTLKVGHGATKAGRAEKSAHRSTVAAGFNAEADTVVTPGFDAMSAPVVEELPEHRR